LSLNSLQLFASKYKLYLPTEDELRKEIENQKNIFYLQQKDSLGLKMRFYSFRFLLVILFVK
ncbi:MAG: hypothetical protein SPJ04_09505, partial [Bdellovibrionota bacterium]|nr:hypothetical protein [Bdellovibrionota bacterium]